MSPVALLAVLTQPVAPRTDLSSAVVYEVNFRAFSEQGGFNGVTDRLDHIKDLGVNVLWLMPIFPVGKVRSAGGLGSPYAIQNFDEVNPELGTREDFRKLVRTAQGKGMKVILDWVANHTSWDNPWLKNKDWYTQDAKGEITIPAGTNWNDVADLNFDNQAMRVAMIRSMENWIRNEGIDGFRCDHADGVPADFWKSAITTLRAASPKPLFLLAEGARNDHLSSGFDLIFGWQAYGSIKEIYEGKRPVSDWEKSVLSDKTPSLRFITNHDEAAWDNSTVTIFGGADAAFGAFAAVAMSGGVPLIYNGQEIAWPEKIPFFDRYKLDWTSGQDHLKRTKRLMEFRARLAAARGHDFKSFSAGKVIAFSKYDNQESVLALINSSKEPAMIEIPPEFAGTWINAFSERREVVTINRKLAGFETVLLSRRMEPMD